MDAVVAWFATLDWAAIGQIILIDILLGGDNAVVIALACRNLPARQRRLGIFWGAAGAIILRVILISFAVALLNVPALKLIGGALHRSRCARTSTVPYSQKIDAAHEKLVWTHPGTENWYRNSRGRVVAITPWRNDAFWRMTREANPDDLEFRFGPRGQGTDKVA